MKKTTIALFLGAVLLLGFAGANGARAALNYYSDSVQSNLQFDEMKVSIVENGEVVGEDTALLSGMLAEDEKLVLGQNYDETIAVTNDGGIDEYVRVTVYKYWLNRDGEKDTLLDPALIELGYVDGTSWMKDEAASTSEREVFYYNKALVAGATSENLIDSICIDPSVATKVNYVIEGNVITTYFEYDGETFVLECEVDSVQTHNAEDAMASSWGRSISVTNGVLSLD